MKTLCCMLFVILSVVANEESFIIVDDTREALAVGEAPYFVTILKNNTTHVCNGVILTERFVLTAADCILEEDIGAYSVVYGTTQFDSVISPDNKNQILNIFGVPENNSVGENIILKKYIRRNKYTDEGHNPHHIDDIIHHNHDHNNDDNNDDDDVIDDYEDDYDTVRETILLEILVVEVEPFTFNNIVYKINLPEPFEDIPSDKGTLVFRSADESLQSQQFPSESEVLSLDNIELYYGAVSRNETQLLRGSPFVINDTLYGLLAVIESEEEDDISLLISIPRVINLINNII